VQAVSTELCAASAPTQSPLAAFSQYLHIAERHYG